MRLLKLILELPTICIYTFFYREASFWSSFLFFFSFFVKFTNSLRNLVEAFLDRLEIHGHEMIAWGPFWISFKQTLFLFIRKRWMPSSFALAIIIAQISDLFWGWNLFLTKLDKSKHFQLYFPWCHISFYKQSKRCFLCAPHTKYNILHVFYLLHSFIHSTTRK